MVLYGYWICHFHTQPKLQRNLYHTTQDRLPPLMCVRHRNLQPQQLQTVSEVVQGGQHLAEMIFSGNFVISVKFCSIPAVQKNRNLYNFRKFVTISGILVDFSYPVLPDHVTYGRSNNGFIVSFICLFSGSVRVYDYASKTPLCSSSFNAGATSLLWLPQIVSINGLDVSNIHHVQIVKISLY